MSLSYAESVGRQSIDTIKRAREALIVSLGIIITDLVAHNAASMRTGASIGEHALKAIPSALIPAEVSDDLIGQHSQALDLAVDLGPLGLSTILAKDTTASTKEMVKLAVGAQLLATASDMTIVESHLTSRTELTQQDVGSSAITVAFFSKYLFDKVASSETERRRRAWQLVTGVFAGAVTLGAAYIDSKNFSTDLTSHGSGVVAGAFASQLGNSRPLENQPQLADDAATETLVPSVENR